jgi:uncharacterized protein YlxW (UPF0749 family)
MGSMSDPIRILGLAELADEYRPPPRHQHGEPWSPSVRTVLTVAAAIAVGFLLSSGVLAGRTATHAQDERRAALIALIEERQEHVDAMAEQLEALRGRVTTVEEQFAAGVPALSRDLERAEQAAGLTALIGPGVVVTLTDADGACPSGQAQDCEIQDTDLQLAVNALFGAGAEAVAVNGERVIASTAIRSAGRAVLMNYRMLAPPYEITAVGDPDALDAGFRATDFARSFEIWQRQYGLGYTVAVAERVEIPAYAGSVRLRHATASRGGSP